MTASPALGSVEPAADGRGLVTRHDDVVAVRQLGTVE